MAKGKHVRKPARKNKKIGLITAIVVLTILLISMLMIYVIPQWLYGLNGDTDNLPDNTGSAQIQETSGGIETDESDESETTANGTQSEEDFEIKNVVSFPVTVAEGKLEITGLHTYNGINPDCGNMEGSNIATIILTNTSEEYLTEANVTLNLSDGTVANFKITDLPAGRTSMAFSTENAVLAGDAVCVEAYCDATFNSNASLSEDVVSVSVDGMSITLTNISGSELNNIVVYCHSILEPDYFGGVTYIYNIENLAIGASATVDAVYCVLGLAEVVRIDAE